MSVRVRFAPSPTGMLHIGNARTALITWLFARKNNGHFLLRIDDTDQTRSKVEYEQAIEESLIWLGLPWDEKANQKDRMARYEEQIEKLKNDGRLYACYETPEELSLKRKSLLSRGKPPIYDRAALELTDEQIAAYEAEGRKPHWRFKLLEQPITWHDHIRGDVKFHGKDLSDPVVIREDGSPLYHLCSVIDDIDFRITHVVRGEDHVSNTATHVQMFEALGDYVPDFAHLALVSDLDGEKLSKRFGSVSVIDLRDKAGFEPMAVVSLLGRIGTSQPIEAFDSLQPLIDAFDFSKFSRGTPKLDPDEILRLNAKIIHGSDFNAVNVRLSNMGLQDIDDVFWEGVKANLDRLSDIQDIWGLVHGDVTPVIDDADYIAQALELLPPAPWTRDSWNAWTGRIKTETGRKGRDLFMPLRLAITGQSHGPEMPDLFLLIGEDKVRQRLAG